MYYNAWCYTIYNDGSLQQDPSKHTFYLALRNYQDLIESFVSI